MWDEIRGQVKRWAGASGTVTLPPNAIIISIIAHASAGGASCAFNDGAGGTATVPVPNGAWFAYDPKHKNNAVNATSNTIVFTATDSYLVEAVIPLGA